MRSTIICLLALSIAALNAPDASARGKGGERHFTEREREPSRHRQSSALLPDLEPGKVRVARIARINLQGVCRFAVHAHTKNIGNYVSAASRMGLTVGGIYHDIQAAGPLGSGQETVRKTLRGQVAGKGVHSVLIRTDVDAVITESDESNNIKSININCR